VQHPDGSLGYCAAERSSSGAARSGTASKQGASHPDGWVVMEDRVMQDARLSMEQHAAAEAAYGDYDLPDPTAATLLVPHNITLDADVRRTAVADGAGLDAASIAAAVAAQDAHLVQRVAQADARLRALYAAST
jgi:hypothetical protein